MTEPEKNAGHPPATASVTSSEWQALGANLVNDIKSIERNPDRKVKARKDTICIAGIPSLTQNAEAALPFNAHTLTSSVWASKLVGRARWSDRQKNSTSIPLLHHSHDLVF
ncbi:MAG: hypothetical protein AAGH17_07620 [Pseudomonadota bacterium]